MADPQDQQDPQKDSVSIQKFLGLRNTKTLERLAPGELEYATNIDLDDIGQVHRRRGKTKVATGKFSSLFTSDEGNMFAVKDGVLGIVNPDYSFVSLKDGMSQNWDPLAYIQVGKTNVYFSGRSTAGIIDQDALSVRPWMGPNLGGTPVTDPPTRSIPSPDYWYSPVVNPTVTLPPIHGKILGPPPLATTLAYYNGRIYLGNKNIVWYTELFNYLYVDKTRNFWQFEADVTMIGSVTDGIYVGTKEGLWFISTPKWFGRAKSNEAKRIRVLDSGVIPGSMVYIPTELSNPTQVPLENQQPVKTSILFLTNNGYCGGQDSGVCYNFTESSFIFPDAESAAAIYRRQDGMNQYLAVTNSRGTPSTNARFGDHLDVELRRAGTWRENTDTLVFSDSFEATIV